MVVVLSHSECQRRKHPPRPNWSEVRRWRRRPREMAEAARDDYAGAFLTADARERRGDGVERVVHQLRPPVLRPLLLIRARVCAAAAVPLCDGRRTVRRRRRRTKVGSSRRRRRRRRRSRCCCFCHRRQCGGELEEWRRERGEREEREDPANNNAPRVYPSSSLCVLAVCV